LKTFKGMQEKGKFPSFTTDLGTMITALQQDKHLAMYRPIQGMDELSNVLDSSWTSRPSDGTLQDVRASVGIFAAFIHHITGNEPELAWVLDGRLVKRFMLHASQSTLQKSTVQKHGRGIIRTIIYLMVMLFMSDESGRYSEEAKKAQQLAAATYKYANQVELKPKKKPAPRPVAPPSSAASRDTLASHIHLTVMPRADAPRKEVVDLAVAMHHNVGILVDTLQDQALKMDDNELHRSATFMAWAFKPPLLTPSGLPHPGTLRSGAVANIQLPSTSYKCNHPACFSRQDSGYVCDGNRLEKDSTDGTVKCYFKHNKQAELSHGNHGVLEFQVMGDGRGRKHLDHWTGQVVPRINSAFKSNIPDWKDPGTLVFTAKGLVITNTTYELERGVMKAASFLPADSPLVKRVRVYIPGRGLVEVVPFPNTKQYRSVVATMWALGADAMLSYLSCRELALCSLTSIPMLRTQYCPYPWLSHRFVDQADGGSNMASTSTPIITPQLQDSTARPGPSALTAAAGPSTSQPRLPDPAPATRFGAPVAAPLPVPARLQQTPSGSKAPAAAQKEVVIKTNPFFLYRNIRLVKAAMEQRSGPRQRQLSPVLQAKLQANSSLPLPMAVQPAAVRQEEAPAGPTPRPSSPPASPAPETERAELGVRDIEVASTPGPHQQAIMEPSQSATDPGPSPSPHVGFTPGDAGPASRAPDELQTSSAATMPDCGEGPSSSPPPTTTSPSSPAACSASVGTAEAPRPVKLGEKCP
jgi:hypothetical protein